MADDRAFLIDTSHWEPYLDATKLVGLDGIVGRIGTQWTNLPSTQWMDQTGPVHCGVADLLDIPYGEFFYDDWTYWLDMQYNKSVVENFTPDTDPRIVATRRALFSGGKMRKIHFIGIDVEQAPHAGMSQTDNWANWISASARSYVDNLLYMMSHGEIPVMPIFMYSRKSYIDQWCKLANGACPLTDWMTNYQKNLVPGRFFDWIADWNYSRADSNVTYTAATAKALTLPLASDKPKGFSDWPDLLWQYGGDDPSHRVHMIGVEDERHIPLVVDVNVTPIPKKDFYTAIKFTPRGTPAPDPDPEPEPVPVLIPRVVVEMLSNETNERTEPSYAKASSVVGKVVKGQTLGYWVETRIIGSDTWYRVTGSPAGGNPKTGETWVAGTVTQYGETKQYSRLITILVKE